MLGLSDVTLSPAFAISNKTSYTARVPYSTDETTVSYTADVGAMVVIQDFRAVNNGAATLTGNAIADADGKVLSGHQIDLDDGAFTVIPVVVTAEDGATPERLQGKGLPREPGEVPTTPLPAGNCWPNVRPR